MSDGKRMGCHETRESAASQIGAIEASEGNKEMSDTIALDPHSLSAVVDRKEIPPSVISFDELEDADRAQRMAREATEAAENFSQLVRNIILNDGIDRESALNRLVGELMQRIENVNRIQMNMNPKEVYDKSAIKRENGMDFPAKDYAFVPDPAKPSTWKLRLTESPGKVTVAQLGRAAAAISPGGFRGNRAKVPETVIAHIKRRIRAEYSKLGVSPQLIPNTVKDSEDGSGFQLWKGKDGVYRWLAVYSNNFRDDDYVPEIISEKSHRTFEYLVDNGVVDMPELWLWHTEGTAWGQADMITYSDGFSLAAGHVFEGKEYIAESLAKAIDEGEEIGVSHGMPANWIKRNEEDPTIIDFHITSEISPLPKYAAANKLTGFVVFGSGDEEMSIPANKKMWLTETAGLSPEWVERLESGLAKSSDEATQSGVESKEVDAIAEVEMVSEEEAEEIAIEEMKEEAPEQVQVVEAQDVQEESPELVAASVPDIQEESPEIASGDSKENQVEQSAVSREEIADVFVALMKSNEEMVSGLESRVKELEVEIAGLKQTDAEKISEVKEDTPTDSLISMISQRVIGSESARVDGRTSLAKEGPEETESKGRDYTGSPFLNGLMYGSQATVE